ncbi:MAG: hypothetical protein WC634_03200 [archaeon]
MAPRRMDLRRLLNRKALTPRKKRKGKQSKRLPREEEAFRLRSGNGWKREENLKLSRIQAAEEKGS